MARSAAHEAAGGGSGDALTAAAVAEAVGGTLIGNGSHPLRGLAPLDRADESHLSFLGSARYSVAFQSSKAGVVLVPPALAALEGGPAIRIVVAKPHEALLSLIPRFHPPRVHAPGVHPTAVLGRGVRLGANVHVAAGAVLGEGVELGDRAVIGATVVLGDGVRVGDDSLVHAGATLYPGTILGRRVIVHSGARLGSDGYGYVFRDGAHQKIPHVGRCIVEDDVEIGANTTIDRGSIDDTVIGAGTKIDNLVQIGHNVRVGRLCLVMSQVGISGSARIEDGCIIAGQAGIAGHHVIGKGARIGGQAGVFGDVPAGETWSGYPARPHGESMRAQAAMFRLPKLLRALEKLVAGEERLR